jgi:hypothetical protein
LLIVCNNDYQYYSKITDNAYMKKLCFIFFTFLAIGLWAQDDIEITPPASDAVANDADENVPAVNNAAANEVVAKVSYAVIHNEFYEASIKERNLARITLASGNYDESIFHSEEAERLARLSDEYITKMMLRARAVLELIRARDHIAWAKANDAEQYYPKELSAAQEHYAIATEAKNVEDWQAAFDAAALVAIDLAGIAAPPSPDAPLTDMPPNPTQYVVRPWDIFGDCFWNIAKWFYDNPWRWLVIYEANKDKIPDPDNPNLIEVGTVIDIPAIRGEARTGRYDTGAPYMP